MATPINESQKHLVITKKGGRKRIRLTDQRPTMKSAQNKSLKKKGGRGWVHPLVQGGPIDKEKRVTEVTAEHATTENRRNTSIWIYYTEDYYLAFSKGTQEGRTPSPSTDGSRQRQIIVLTEQLVVLMGRFACRGDLLQKWRRPLVVSGEENR